ncbi:hypothetical protein QF019_002308 [Pseudomonas frederiksbergensis]
MNKPLFALLVVLAASSGCSCNSPIYRNQRLLAAHP